MAKSALSEEDEDEDEGEEEEELAADADDDDAVIEEPCVRRPDGRSTTKGSAVPCRHDQHQAITILSCLPLHHPP